MLAAPPSQLPPGMLMVEEEEAREEARAEAAAHLHGDDGEDAPDYAEDEDEHGDGILPHDWDDSRPVGGLVVSHDGSTPVLQPACWLCRRLLPGYA